jgi:hypothetical protein
MTVEPSDDERAGRGQQLFDEQVLVFFAAAVATIEFIDRCVINAERAVGRDELIVNKEFRHENTVGVGSPR